VFCRPVVTAPAVDAALTEGRLRPRQRRRIMSYPLVIRLMIAMTLMPDASYCEALRGVAGLLADIPFTGNGTSRRGKWSRTGGCRSRRT
jgi:hypothetical protein